MSRPLTDGEIRLARSVFGAAIDFSRVRISTRRWGAPAVAIGSHITFPPHPPTPDDFSRASLPMRAWFIHEMAHVQQFQSAWLRTTCSWLTVLFTGGYGRGCPGYRYAAPFRRWGAYNLEQQATMVEHAYVLREMGAPAAAPEGVALADYERCVPYLSVRHPPAARRRGPGDPSDAAAG